MKLMKKTPIIAIFLCLYLAWPLWAKEYGPIRPNETLVQVARKFKPREATLGQAIIAIYIANPDAFENGNPHQIKKGAVLTIPEKEKFFALSSAQASGAFFELNQKYPSPPAPKTTPPKREETVAKSGRDTEKIIQLPKRENDRDSALMPLSTPSVMPKPSAEQSPNTASPTELPLQQPEPEKPPQAPSAETPATPPAKSTPQDILKTTPATSLEEESPSLAKIAPWIGGASILAFLLIFYLLRRERRSEPWEVQAGESEHHPEFMHAPRKSLEEELEEQPERADLVLRLARQYSRNHDTKGLASLIEKAQQSPALQSVLPDLYRLGKVAALEPQAFKGDDAGNADIDQIKTLQR
jgi:FimV-like protein